MPSRSSRRLDAHMPGSLPEAGDSELEVKVWAERARMLCAHVPTVMTMAVGFALALCMMLRTQVDPFKLWFWFGLRSVVVVARLVQAHYYMAAKDPANPVWYRSFVALAVLDGALWGAAWWALVPVDRLDMTAITLTAILGVASLSAFILHADVMAMAWHVLPMLLPNVIYSLNRQDSYGLFGAVSLATFAVFLLLETRRAQGRLVELLTLRFVHERVLKEREQALALAQHHSEAKSNFLASMSHEMRTPLHGILGLTRLLRDDEIRPVAQRRLELLERSGEHLLTVINDVLDVSKIEAGHVQIEHACFDLAELIDEIAGVSTVTAHRKGLQLLLQSDLPASYPVEGDAMRVRQILHNLLGNAIKFTDQGRVTLTVQRLPERQQMRFIVQDTGIGIPESEQAHIFDAFHQVDNALDKRHGGTGLGLTISRQLCLAMGGDLKCSSQRGAGSTFECLLRLLPVDALPAAPAPSPELAHNQNRHLAGLVLLVEDNPINAMVAEAALRQTDMQIHIVDDGKKALEWLAEHRPDIILMDCQMPVMDGFEAARRIRDQELRQGVMRVPMVALTANVFPAERQRCLNAGMDDYLGKPFSKEDLHRVMASCLAAYKRVSNA
jgi:signal transduction histidine kinase/ActR/RegA family two-component response regulator